MGKAQMQTHTHTRVRKPEQKRQPAPAHAQLRSTLACGWTIFAFTHAWMRTRTHAWMGEADRVAGRALTIARAGTAVGSCRRAQTERIACAFGVDGSTRRCSGEPQRADRWATTADSVRGADDSSTVGCRVPCAPRERRSAGGRGSIGLRVEGTPVRRRTCRGQCACALQRLFTRHMRGRRYLSSTRPSGGAANAKQQKPIRARTPLSECKAAYCHIYFTFILAFKKVCAKPRSSKAGFKA